VTCRDHEVTRAAGHLLHARLATIVGERPAQLATRSDRRAVAERVAFDEAPVPALDPGVADLVARARALGPAPAADHAATDGEAPLGPAQLVHAELAGNVLLDPSGAPVVIDVAPAWRPARWADAVCVLDAVLRQEAPHAVLHRWAHGPDRVAMVRAIVFRLLSDDRPDVDAWARVLASVAAGPGDEAGGHGGTG